MKWGGKIVTDADNFSLHLAVQANCTSWPNMDYPHDNLPQPSNLRGLLEAPNASFPLNGSDYLTQNNTLSVGSNTSVLPVQPRKALD